MTEVTINLPPPIRALFVRDDDSLIDRGELRYRAAWGGRGSGKSFGFAKMAAVFGLAEPLRVLCTRDLQVSIKESMHAELRRAIASEPWLEAHYEVGESFIKGANGTDFIFRGLRHNISSIKSMAAIDLCIVEEAEDVPEGSWRALIPTIRAPKSEIWAIWNPRLDGSPVDARLRKSAPERALVAEVHYWDNNWLPAELDEARMEDQRRLDPATYAHIWEGANLENSDAQILAKKVRVSEFEPEADWSGPHFGVDWGFAKDPTAGVRCWVYDGALYIEHEAHRVGLEIDATPEFLRERLPEIETHAPRADSARPETIAYCRSHGIPRMEGAKKGPGSLEDGIEHMKGYREIVVHPRCREWIRESRVYSYAVDRLSGLVLPKVVDANNHMMDATRYALEPIMRKRKSTVATGGKKRVFL